MKVKHLIKKLIDMNRMEDEIVVAVWSKQKKNDDQKYCYVPLCKIETGYGDERFAHIDIDLSRAFETDITNIRKDLTTGITTYDKVIKKTKLDLKI